MTPAMEKKIDEVVDDLMNGDPNTIQERLGSAVEGFTKNLMSEMNMSLDDLYKSAYDKTVGSLQEVIFPPLAMMGKILGKDSVPKFLDISIKAVIETTIVTMYFKKAALSRLIGSGEDGTAEIATVHQPILDKITEDESIFAEIQAVFDKYFEIYGKK